MKNVLIFLVIMLFASCSKGDKSIGEVASKDSVLIKGYLGQSSSVWRDEGHTVLTKSINGLKNMKIITDTLVNYSETGDVTFNPLDLYMFDSSGAETMNVKSVNGFFMQKNFLTIATEDVELKAETANELIYLYTDSLVFLQKEDEVHTFPAHVKIFTKSMDTLLYVIKAKKGVWNLTTLKSVLTESVIIEYKKDNVELHCEDLLFDSEKDIVISKSHVLFRRVSGDFIEGDGFISDSKFKHWKIQRNIKGEVFDINMDANNL